MEKPDRNNLTIGDLWTNIWYMSWPMLGIMVFNFFVGLADVYVAGLISPGVQAAVGFVSQIYFFSIIVANAISIGTLAIVSRAIGSGDSRKAIDTAKQSMLFSIVVAAGLTTFTFIFNREIIAAAGFPSEIREIAEKFLEIFALSLGPNYILIISNAVFRSSGEAQKPLFTMFVVSVINIIGDFVLVFGISPFPEMGYQGIAVSTTLSVTIGMFLNLLFFGRGGWKPVYSGPWALSLAGITKIVVIAWPSAILQVAWGAGTIALYNILGRLGSESISAMASLTNGLRIEAVIYLPAFALNMAASVLVGQNLGAGKAERAASAGWKIARAGVLVISLMSVAVFALAGYFSSLFTDSQDVLQETARYLRFNMLSEPFMALSAILAGGLQGARDTRGTMWIIIAAMWFVRLPLAYFLAITLGYGAVGVWTAMITSMALQGILTSVRFYRGHWKIIKVG